MNKKTRLGIFACSDKDGVIDDYILYLLRDVMENLTDLIVVFNGVLSVEGRKRLESVTPYVVMRKNQGFDAAAWKFAMTEYWSWEKVDTYDDLLLFNDTFFGPFYPFRLVFEEMEKRNVDFWGLSAHYEAPDTFGTSLYGYIPTCIQSYFIHINRRMHTSPEFKRYWEMQPTFLQYEDLVGKNEVVFTKHFSDAGFQWDVLIDTEDFRCAQREKNYNLYAIHPYILIRDKAFPVLKRKLFIMPLRFYLDFNMGNELYQSMRYIRECTSYDISLIWKHLLRMYNIADLNESLGLENVISTLDDAQKTVEQIASDAALCRRAGVFLHIWYIDQLAYIESYVRRIPEEIDVWMTAHGKERAEALKTRFARYANVRIKEVESRGRDLSALLIGARPELDRYDYICFCHDKKSSQTRYRATGIDFQNLLFENLLANSSYIRNILRIFEEDERLGLAVPPVPTFGEYGSLWKNFWTCNFAKAKTLAEDLGIYVEFDETKNPPAIGTAFWCRRTALRLILDHSWQYEDFPQEPLAADGTISHALERLFPYAAQAAGYYTIRIMTPRQAAVEMRNMRYLARITPVQTVLYKHDRLLRRLSKTLLPQKLYTPLARLYKKWIYR